MKALISTSDRTDLPGFARALLEAGFELASTGGTGAALEEAGLPVTQVSRITGFPELMDGRVKTLHPSVHAGILARRGNENDAAQLAHHLIDTIDVVVVNLYPFVETVSGPGAALDQALENIDVGGPAMIRAAAKNFPDVIVVVDPADYGWVAERLNGTPPSISREDRQRLAQKAFQHVAAYDTAISRYLAGPNNSLSGQITLGYEKLDDLRYGENPHQTGALYADPLSTGGIARAERLHGMALSFTNILDADAAWRIACDFESPMATVIKHANPCGLAVHPDQPTAYKRALEGDPTSAYGGILGFNRTVTAATSEAMRGVLYHIVVAPDFEPEALSILKRRKQLRVLRAAPERGPGDRLDARKIGGGALIQAADVSDEDFSSWEVVTDRAPNGPERRDLALAWKASRHVKSNAIVLARDNAMVGMGAGQPNRVTSVHLALRLAGDEARGSALASDAFMPFADNVEIAAAGGVTAIVQPGGSLRDQEVIEAANKLGVAMVFTGTRHFLH